MISVTENTRLKKKTVFLEIWRVFINLRILSELKQGGEETVLMVDVDQQIFHL
jgi:hypothetical protein